MPHSETKKNTLPLVPGQMMKNASGSKIVMRVKTETLYLMSKWDDYAKRDDWYTIGDLRALGYKKIRAEKLIPRAEYPNVKLSN